MKKLMLGALLAIGLLSSNLNAKVRVLNDLKIITEFEINQYDECVIWAGQNDGMTYNLLAKKGTKDCEILKNLNLKKDKSYNIKMDVEYCDEGDCGGRFISIVK